MDNSNTAVEKFEVAVELVNETTRTDEAGGEDGDIKFTPIQVRQLMKKFEVLDDDKDKTLDIEGLRKAFRIIGQNPTEQQLQAIVKEADLDENGKIDSEEFTRLLIRNMQSREEVKKELRQAFAVFDTHGDGRVDQADLVSTLKLCGETPLTECEAEELVKVMDKDKDGFIDTEEFVNYLCKSIPVRFYMIKT